MRLAILQALDGGSGMPVTALCHELPGHVGLSVVAFHLRVLEDAGLVRSSSNGLAPVYALP